MSTSCRTILCLALILPGVAAAQYQGPSSQSAYSTVAEVLADPIDDQQVSLQGRIVIHEGGEYYRFADESGEIRIELEAEDMPGFSFDENTPVVIFGDIDKEPMRKSFIEVDRVELASAP